MTYDVVLIEHAVGDGLSVEETTEMLRAFDENAELIPLEIDSRFGDSSAMGFITTKAEETLYTRVSPTDFEEYVGAILSDLSLEHEDHVYRYEDLTIWIARFAPPADAGQQKIIVPLHDGVSLVAEHNWWEPGIKEVFVSIDKDGLDWQNLAVVREAFSYDENLNLVPIPSMYEVLVYADSDKEDYTHKFTICEHEEEEASDE